jgi:hypothetical protein
MKIAILTQPLHTNYGGLLQAFALQKVLKSMGHEVLIVNLPFRLTTFAKLRGIAKRTVKKYLLRQKNSQPIFIVRPTLSEKKLISQHTNRFIQENIQTTFEIPFVEKLYRLKKYHFDAYVVGSDQVWRPQYSPGISDFFLDFLGKDKQTRRISYAASFGVDNWEFSRKQTEKCKKLAQRFDAISVREDSGVRLCKEYLGTNATHLVDPTLLLNKEDYIELIHMDIIPERKDSVMVYILDKSKQKDAIVQKVVQHFNLSFNSVMSERNFSGEAREFINDCVVPPVSHWIKGFIDASYVVTDSFHGTVFSIIFNKPFIVIANKERGITRFTSLLTLFGLGNRLVSSVDQLSTEFLSNPIDFSTVNKIKAEQQTKSQIFLINALKN